VRIAEGGMVRADCSFLIHGTSVLAATNQHAFVCLPFSACAAGALQPPPLSASQQRRLICTLANLILRAVSVWP
jgi:hypothetical protein